MSLVEKTVINFQHFWGFLNEPSEYQLIKMDSAPWSQF